MSATWTDAEALRYIASYPDLIRALGANPAAGRAHYAAAGQAEGRSIRFDALGYAASYADLAAAFGANEAAAARHYIIDGAREGRTASFDALRYIASYADLSAAFGTDTAAATRHYLTDGIREGRVATFDALKYTASYADLALAFGTDTAAATRHFITTGRGEGRTPNFDALQYTASYADLIAAFGTDTAAATRHYITTGVREGRSASFDSVAYLLSNPDLGAAGLNATTALRHWIIDGFREGRTGDAAYGREQTSHALAVGQTVSSALQSMTDKDWFRLDLVAGQGVRLELTRTGIAQPGNTSDLEVYSANGADRQNTIGQSTSTGTLTGFVAPATGIYYVSTASPTGYVGNYSLSASAFNNVQTSGQDFIAGTDGNDVMTSEGSFDFLFGGRGNDVYVLSTSQTLITERPGEGIDEVRSTVSVNSLRSNVENITLLGTANINAFGNSGDNLLTGNAGNNLLNGGTGNDSLSGGGGTDTMAGGRGDDWYVVDSLDDVVTENPGEGTDTVNASVSVTLAANVENLVLLGTAGLEATGNALDNVITGNSGNNGLDGGAGADTLIGGGGDDQYAVDDPGDTIVEAPGGGYDVVYSFVDFALPDNVERLILYGAAAVGAGNVLDNYILGNNNGVLLSGDSGNDTLFGGSGSDTLVGGLDDDSYFSDSADDIITEGFDEGIDTLNSGASRTLPANVENLVLVSFNDDDGTGNGLDNVITGNTRDNRLDGGSGDDTLAGGAGQDILTGGTGADIFLWSTPPASAASDFAGTTAATADRITDFSQDDGDRIDLRAVDSAPQLEGVSAWNWIGNAAFQTGPAGVGQLRYENTGGQTLILGDYNGDAVADIAIVLDGIFDLTQVSAGVIG